MRRFLVMAGCVILALGLRGCGGIVEGIRGGDEQFPEVMVGTWEAEIGPSEWVFKFGRDGSILKMTHSVVGEVDLKEDTVYVEGEDPNVYGVFIMGPCEAKYDADTHELQVEIILDYYKMVLEQGEVEGKVHDYIKGPISEDGKIWQALWFNYLWMEGASPPDPSLVEAYPMPLVFIKIDSG